MAHAILVPGFERRDERGVFREVLNGFDARSLLCGRMRKSAVLGNHFHRRTRVFFYLTRGEADVRTFHVETGERDSFSLRENEGVFFEVNESHAIRFAREGEFVMLKSLPYDPASPDTFPHPVE